MLRLLSADDVNTVRRAGKGKCDGVNERKVRIGTILYYLGGGACDAVVLVGEACDVDGEKWRRKRLYFFVKNADLRRQSGRGSVPGAGNGTPWSKHLRQERAEGGQAQPAAWYLRITSRRRSMRSRRNRSVAKPPAFRS